MILQYIEEHESITNKEARELLGLAESTTKRILKDMVKQGVLCEQGERKLRKYYLA